MKTNNYRKQKCRKKREVGHFDDAYIYEARKMIASSECLNPYESEPMNDYMKYYFREA